MATKKTGLTLEQHRELGAKLRQIHDTLIHEAVAVANAYPKKSPEAQALIKVAEVFREARSKLDDAVCREHPNDQSVLGIYFGPADTRNSAHRGTGLSVLDSTLKDGA